MKIFLGSLVVATSLLITGQVCAQIVKNDCDRELQICEEPVIGAVELIQHQQPTRIVVDDHDDAAVLIAAHNLQTDLQAVAGIKEALDQVKSTSAIIVGTLNHSEVIDRLVHEHKLDISGVTGVWKRMPNRL